MDWGEVRSPDNPMKAFFSLPQVLGHEVVADVVALGPEAEGLEVGDRVVLNPWLSCGPRGVEPMCAGVPARATTACAPASRSARSHRASTSGRRRTRSGGYAELMPAHDSLLFKVPDEVPDELAVFADPFAVMLHAITRHPPVPRRQGDGVRRRRARHVRDRDPARALARRRRARRRRASSRRPRSPASSARPSSGTSPRLRVIEEAAAWSGGVLQDSDGLPMAYPGGIDVVYDTVGKQETFEVGCRVLKARGTHREGGRARPDLLGGHAAVLQGDQLRRVERVRLRGGRRRAQARHRRTTSTSCATAVSTSRGMLTHTFPLDENWRDAFVALATQDRSGAIKVAFDQR